MRKFLAVQGIRPALSRTIGIFWPLKAGQWIRLLIIAFFIGAWMVNPIQGSISGSVIPFIGDDAFSGQVHAQTGLISAIITGMLVLLLVYALFSSIFQFIFVDYLSAGHRGILPSFRVRLMMGVRLLCFYLGLILLAGALALVVIIAVAIPLLMTNPGNPEQTLKALVYSLSWLLLLIIPLWVLSIMTTDFVVPVMIIRHCGIIRGWQMIGKEFSGKWGETGVYLAIKMSINLLTGFVIGIILVTIGGFLGISSLAFISGSLYEEVSGSPVHTLAPMMLMGIITLVVMTPVVTFLRYYALIFLEQLSDTYALLPGVYSAHPKRADTRYDG